MEPTLKVFVAMAEVGVVLSVIYQLRKVNSRQTKQAMLIVFGGG